MTLDEIITAIKSGIKVRFIPRGVARIRGEQCERDCWLGRKRLSSEDEMMVVENTYFPEMDKRSNKAAIFNIEEIDGIGYITLR